MDEETQFQLALRLSREEQERRLQVQQKQDFETALKLQREELERAPPSTSQRRSPITRFMNALSNALIGPNRQVEDEPGANWIGKGFVNDPASQQFHHETCTICHQSLPYDGRRVSWCEHPFWKEKFCGYHNDDGTPRCASCERLKPFDTQWAILSDGREICVNCSETMIFDTQHCQPLYDNVLQLFRSLQLTLPTRPPMMLVDRPALNERSPVQGHGGSQQTRGMTLTEEYRTVRTVVQQRGSIFGQAVNTYPVEHRECHVTAILVLFGLPRLLTGSILAHECMHAYLKLTQSPKLTPAVEEGLCQLMAYLWIERQQLSDPFEKRLASFIASQIRTHPSPIYGDGFRMALASFQCYGLPNLINHVKLTTLFPEPRQ